MEAAKIGVHGISEIEFEQQSHWREFVFGVKPERTLIRVLIWSVLTICFFHKLLMPIQIIGSSMNPTYQNGALNFVNRWSYAKGAPHRGDVIALKMDDEMLLKRIIALPGETISIQEGQIQIDHHPLRDAFSKGRIPWEMDEVFLGPNEYFVIGDNRAASVFCRVKKEQILGKTVF